MSKVISVNAEEFWASLGKKGQKVMIDLAKKKAYEPKNEGLIDKVMGKEYETTFGELYPDLKPKKYQNLLETAQSLRKKRLVELGGGKEEGTTPYLAEMTTIELTEKGRDLILRMKSKSK